MSDLRKRRLSLISLMEESEDIRKKRSCWVHEWNTHSERSAFSFTNTLEKQLENSPHHFKKYFRRDVDSYELLLSKIESKLTKKDTQLRRSNSARERLSITLSFLTRGTDQFALGLQYRIGQPTVSKILSETLAAIYDVMAPEYLKTPSTEQEWKEIADDFLLKWDFPHCLGALDGKHVYIFKPPNSGSAFFNYKSTFSTVLMAICDANYRFLFVNAGANGRISDGGVWANTSMKRAIEKELLEIPAPAVLPMSTDKVAPYCFLGDSAFALKTYLMKPYNDKTAEFDERVYNYRHCRARRVIDNAVGILCMRWRVLLNTMNYEPAKSELIAKVCCVLHNYMLARTKTDYMKNTVDSSPDTEDGDWRNEFGFFGVNKTTEHRGSDRAHGYRNQMKNYFLDEYPLSWQDSRA